MRSGYPIANFEETLGLGGCKNNNTSPPGGRPSFQEVTEKSKLLCKWNPPKSLKRCENHLEHKKPDKRWVPHLIQTQMYPA